MKNSSAFQIDKIGGAAFKDYMKYDVIIVGGSVAGLGLAFRLGKAGLSVLVLEKETYPKRKACGEGLSVQGNQILEEWGLGKIFGELPRAPFYSYEVHSRYSRFKTTKTISEDSVSEANVIGFGVKRDVLDSLLLTALESIRNVCVKTESTVVSVSLNADYASVCTSRTEGSQEICYEARFLVLADGARSRTAQRLSIPYASQGETRYASSFRMRIAGSSYNSDLPRINSVHVFLANGVQTCVTQVDSKTVNVSSLTDKKGVHYLKSDTNRRELIQRIQDELGFRGEIVDSPIFIGPVNKRRRKAHFGSNVLLIGDVLEQFDPIGGMGMTHALISAENAAVSLESIFFEGTLAEDAFQDYASRRERSARLLRGFTCLSYMDLVRYEELPLVRRLDNTGLSRLVAKSMRVNSRVISESTLVRFMLSVIGAFI